ncbi:MAG: hypothetical protein AAFQ51_19340 [Pseudomonadota bacterium]
MKPSYYCGTYTGDGAAQNIMIGFEPHYVRIVNITDRDQIVEWFSDMPNGEGVQTAAAVGTLAANGVSLYTGTRGGDSAGFTAGTAVSENGKTYAFIAMRGD